jgi:hypothetical protein
MELEEAISGKSHPKSSNSRETLHLDLKGKGQMWS